MSDGSATPTKSVDSYRSILTSTALIGASSVVVMAISLVRIKALAILLGPAGLGMMALYSSIADLAVAVAGMGVSQSGVRQIAQAEGSGDSDLIARTVRVLGRTSLVLGLGGGLGMMVLALPAAVLTFGSAEYTMAVAALGLVILPRIVAGGQAALLQGVRRVGDLATLNIITALAGAVITVPLVFVWREAAIVPAMILVSAAAWIAAEFYRRRVPLPKPSAATLSRSGGAGELLRLGFAFMVSGFLTMGAAYAIRILVLHESGVHAAGLYQAAWAVAGLYVGFVLQAMGTDFYPRLTGLADQPAQMNRLVNDQTQVSLLLAGPGVIGTIALAPLAMTMLYSTDFVEAAEILRLLCLGMMLRVVAWPMGFIVLAKGWQRIFIITEVIATFIHVGAAALLLPWIGAAGAGAAFLCVYLCHSALIYVIVRWRCEFAFSSANLRLLATFLPASAIAYGGFSVLPFWAATTLGLAIAAGLGLFSLASLAHLTAGQSLPPPILRAMSSLGWRQP